MPVDKAKKVLQAYKDTNYNAKKALISVGYSKETADMQSARTIDNAVNSLARAGAHDALLEFAGMTSADLSREYKSVITQNKNFPAKLRAMEPLLKKKGIEWDNDKPVTTVPVLNLTVSKGEDKVAELQDTSSKVSNQSPETIVDDTKNGSA